MPISAEGSLPFRFLQVHFSNELAGDEAVRGTCRCAGLQPRSARPRRAEPCSPRQRERERGAHNLPLNSHLALRFTSVVLPLGVGALLFQVTSDLQAQANVSPHQKEPHRSKSSKGSVQPIGKVWFRQVKFGSGKKQNRAKPRSAKCRSLNPRQKPRAVSRHRNPSLPCPLQGFGVVLQPSALLGVSRAGRAGHTLHAYLCEQK